MESQITKNYMSAGIDSLEIESEESIINAPHDTLKVMAKKYADGFGLMNMSDFPDIGNEPVASLAWYDDQPITHDCIDEVHDDVIALLHEAEDHCRQYSPAEFWINAINQRDDAEEAWSVVDDAISQVFKRFADNHAEYLKEKWCVTSDEPIALIVSITYEVWDEESLEIGDTDEKGFIHDPSQPVVMGADEFREMVPDLEASQHPITDPTKTWYSRETNIEAREWMEDGKRENRSYHPANEETARFMQILYEE